MNLPLKGDFIDIHTHEAKQAEDVFAIDILMVHEDRAPLPKKKIVYSAGIHPWFLNESEYGLQLRKVMELVKDGSVVAVGEAGFDKLKGPAIEIQRIAFEAQVKLSESAGKPLVIHCVRSFEELLAENKKLRPEMPWLIHGFRGNRDLATQLLRKGMYLSFWFDFIIRPESSELVRNIPANRIFLETDGANVDIRDIYNKVSSDLGIDVTELKQKVLDNYYRFFNINPSAT